tara:strand:- start:552 stop:746 length:195 start_codon:yes stop_codon:yes gene_type:complete
MLALIASLLYILLNKSLSSDLSKFSKGFKKINPKKIEYYINIVLGVLILIKSTLSQYVKELSTV